MIVKINAKESKNEINYFYLNFEDLQDNEFMPIFSGYIYYFLSNDHNNIILHRLKYKWIEQIDSFDTLNARCQCLIGIYEFIVSLMYDSFPPDNLVDILCAWKRVCMLCGANHCQRVFAWAIIPRYTFLRINFPLFEFHHRKLFCTLFHCCWTRCKK